jgi:hypothetical protein
MVVLHAAHSGSAGLGAVAKSGQVSVVDHDEGYRQRGEVLATDGRRRTPVCSGHRLGAVGGWKKTTVRAERILTKLTLVNSFYKAAVWNFMKIRQTV